jgi:MoaA/NifB/PqqE/SkfB family radical SAM enzyme
MELDALGGNYCNLSCNMCSGYSSSKYLAEEIQLKETHLSKALILPNVNEKIWQELPTILENLCELKLVGGEPLIAKNTYKLMEMVPNPENTILRIITNGTQNPDKFINLAKKFKQVIINLSIEGVGEVNEYIRYPSNWNEILENRIKMSRVGRVILVSTINALNINKLYQIPKMGFEYTMSSLVTNNFYSLNSIPDDIKDKYLNELYQHKMIDLIKLLEASKYNADDMWNMLKHIKRRDNLRQTNLLSIWPEWKKYYENCSS